MNYLLLYQDLPKRCFCVGYGLDPALCIDFYDAGEDVIYPAVRRSGQGDVDALGLGTEHLIWILPAEPCE